MGEIDNIVASGGEIRTRADNASVAAKDLTRVANGVRYGTIPAPVGYDLLGNVKVLPWYVREATGYLPRGLERSLQEPAPVVYDRDFAAGQDRDPAAQLAIAAEHLERLNAALREAAAVAEAAQSALAGQGYNPAPELAPAPGVDRVIQEQVTLGTSSPVRRGPDRGAGASRPRSASPGL